MLHNSCMLFFDIYALPSLDVLLSSIKKRLLRKKIGSKYRKSSEKGHNDFGFKTK